SSGSSSAGTSGGVSSPGAGVPATGGVAVGSVSGPPRDNTNQLTAAIKATAPSARYTAVPGPFDRRLRGVMNHLPDGGCGILVDTERRLVRVQLRPSSYRQRGVVLHMTEREVEDRRNLVAQGELG